MTYIPPREVPQALGALGRVRTTSAGSNAFVRYIDRCGVEFDTAVSVLFGGPLGETISLRVAIAERDGRWGGCWFCWFLNWAVQRHHCALQFVSDKPASPMTFVRAGIAFAIGLTSLYELVRAAIRLI